VCDTFEASPPDLLPEEERDGIAMVRGLVFEANVDKPKFVWVRVKADDPVGLHDYMGTLNVRGLEVNFDGLCRDIWRNTIRNRPLRDDVKVYMQAQPDGMEENKSILRVIGMCRRWLEIEAQVNVEDHSGPHGKTNQWQQIRRR
jgi:hypothetical protein